MPDALDEKGSLWSKAKQERYMLAHRPRGAGVRSDILHLVQDNIGTADQVIVFGGLFDAAIRAAWTMLPEVPHRNVMLEEALDRLREEIKRTAPAQVG